MRDPLRSNPSNRSNQLGSARTAALWAALTLGLVAACSNAAGGGPEGVSDRFIDLYVVEIDQARALELTRGVARERVQRELDDVAAVRGTGWQAAARPQVFYERTMFQRRGEAARARAAYDIRIVQGGEESRRHVLVSLEQHQQRWYVSSFVFGDGPTR